MSKASTFQGYSAFKLPLSRSWMGFAAVYHAPGIQWLPDE